MHVPLPRVFGAFFNQGHAPILSDSGVRAALNAAIDKSALVDEILAGYGIPLEDPIPPGVLDKKKVDDSKTGRPEDFADSARGILSRGGWSFDEKNNVWTKKTAKSGTSGKKLELSFSLATADTPELSATASFLAEAWRAAGRYLKICGDLLLGLYTKTIPARPH